MMDLTTLSLLSTESGRSALAQAALLAPTEATLLSCSTTLRKDFPADLARAALEMAILRKKAQAKFARSAGMLFTRQALEQATSEAVSRYRAERFAPFSTIADLCCGLGGDAIALAARHNVIAFDIDPVRIALAEHNLGVYECRDCARFLTGDVLAAPVPNADAFFADPDRRSNGKRHISYRYYQPALDRVREHLPPDAPLGVKMAPAISWNELGELDAEIEFISVNGELKECVAWFGPLKTRRRRATLLPTCAILTADEPAALGEISEPRAFLFDPDPTVVRAGLVTNLAEMIESRLIDPEIAYVTSNSFRATPFATCYRIDEVHPFNGKKLAERLRELKVGRVTICKRGSAIEPVALIRRLKLDGPEHRAVILTRVRGHPFMLIGERVDNRVDG